LLYLRDLLAVKLRKIGVDDDSHVVFLGSGVASLHDLPSGGGSIRA
jgi:hypothetical protein